MSGKSYTTVTKENEFSESMLQRINCKYKKNGRGSKKIKNRDILGQPAIETRSGAWHH